MEVVQLIHNPSAGDEEHGQEELVAQIKAAGFDCRYSSTKKDNWKENINGEAKLIAIAGGDGTVRKVVKQVLKKEAVAKNTLLSVLAMGTANNIAKTMNAEGEASRIIQAWKEVRPRKIDIGEVENVADESFFLEGIGFGLFR